MKGLISVLSLALLWPAHPSLAQLSPPNAAGVAMGHLHFHVRDVEANKTFWMELGATPAKLGTTEVMKLPGVVIFLEQAKPAGGSEGSVVNHVGFRVPDHRLSLEKWEAAGLRTELSESGNVGYVFTPDGEKVEILKDGGQNLDFDPDDGAKDFSVQHSRMTTPIAFHHIHFFGPEGSVKEIKAWYVSMFGARPGKRVHYEVANMPGVELDYSGSPTATAATKGRTLDHIGFEVKNLKVFCRKLETAGVKFNVPYAKNATGVATAILTDPWGASIELTEGLNRL